MNPIDFRLRNNCCCHIIYIVHWIRIVLRVWLFFRIRLQSHRMQNVRSMIWCAREEGRCDMTCVLLCVSDRTLCELIKNANGRFIFGDICDRFGDISIKYRHIQLTSSKHFFFSLCLVLC